MTKVLVTGGTGLVGSHLLEQLQHQQVSVRALSRNPQLALEKPWLKRLKALPIEWVQGDIQDPDSLEDAMEGVTRVYHCAAAVSFDKKQASNLWKTNIDGTANVVNAALASGIEKLAYVSSIAALGRNHTSGLINEGSDWKDDPKNSQYAISKFRAELEVWRGVEEGLTSVIVNPGIILGPGDWNATSSRLIGQIAKGFPVISPGANGFVDVRDVADSLIHAMNTNLQNERYVLVGENLSYRQLFEEVCRRTGAKMPQWEPSFSVSMLAARLLSVKSAFSNGEPALTPEKVRTAFASYAFDSSKIRRTGFAFRKMEDTLNWVCEAYLQANH